jgi:biotin-dependent carboxylase-like uncharacterized protein
VSALRVRQPGLLSLLQDGGRRGRAALGLTTGGPVDPVAFNLCERLLQNPPGATQIEVSFGGLELEAQADTQLCVTGASLPLTINGRERGLWEVHAVGAGDIIHLGFSSSGCRSYLGVRGGFRIAPTFGSTATVVREGIGGLDGGRLKSGDCLPLVAVEPCERLWLAPEHRPAYQHRATLRLIPGYQAERFPRLAQRRFFGSDYTVSDRCDRMGYRLLGPEVRAEIDGIVSEGIALGAVQFPADGQPIALLNDRQTIGGYPKLGCILSLDCALLGQLRPGDEVTFTPISEHAAHNALHLARAFEDARRLEPAPA